MRVEQRFGLRTVLAVFLLGALALSSAALAARGRVHLDTSLGYNVLLTDNNTLLRGVSVSFDGGDPWGSLPVNVPSLESLIALRTDYGLNAVHVFLEGDAGQNPDPVGVNLAAADDLVQRTGQAGLYLIITIGNNGENGSIHSMQKTLDFWNLYGARYANETHVIYEAHNEPVAFTPNHWTPEDWDRQVTIYNTIRAVAPDTFVLLGSFMSFNGGDAAIEGADYLASQGVDWSNAGFAFHGYTGLSSIEDTIAPFKTSTSYPALLCTEFWPGDTENGYNSAFETHHVGWMQFEWLSANDVDLTSFAARIENAGTVWTPDDPTATWPALGSPNIPANGTEIGLYSRAGSGFVSASPSNGYALEADLATYTGTASDKFFVEDAGDGRVYLKAAHGQYASTTSEASVVTADQTTPGNGAKFDWIELANGEVMLRAYGGDGHLLSIAGRGKNSGKIVAAGDNANVEAFKPVDGTQPSDPPPLPAPPPPPAPGPFYGTPLAIPGSIFAADFDYGGQGVAYNDSDAENVGGAYRPDEGVDIQGSTEGGPNVGWVAQGEWMHYTVDVATAGDYTLAARVASGGSGGNFHFEMDGVNVSGTMSSGATGGWQSWVDVNAVVTLNAGVQVLRFESDSADHNILTFTFTEGGTPPPPPPSGGDVHVDSIVMSTSQAGGNRTRGVAVVKIVDDNGVGISGLTVYADWTGLAPGAVTGTTGTDGRATLNSNLVRNANGTFTITVTDVQGAGYTYNASKNVETSDSITVP